MALNSRFTASSSALLPFSNSLCQRVFLDRSCFRQRMISSKFMFWNLVAVQYEKYHMHHILLFTLLMVYSYLGALVFCGIESPYEDFRIEELNKEKVRQSVAAKKILVERVQELYFLTSNSTDFTETKLRKAIDQYDVAMDRKVRLSAEKKWDIWGGLYYAGTIYTTIGYGDLAAETVAGRVFTMIYAIFGIPMVITILNDWGTLMFQAVEGVWKTHCKGVSAKIKQFLQRLRRRKEKDLDQESAPLEPQCGDPDEAEPIPLFLVLVVLIFWVLVCTSIFSIFENWTFFESIYFFFISLTTIGFGDVTPSPRVAVGNFLVILIGLSVVSMSINVVQMQLEIIFAKVVKSIDRDFKMNLSISADENKKIASTNELGDAECTDSTLKPADGDVMKQFGQNMGGTERLLMRFMSNHQRKMLNEKFEERNKMRNKWTQTQTQIKVASVQTADKYDDLLNFPEEEEEPAQKSRINAKRLYIYNTGE